MKCQKFKKNVINLVINTVYKKTPTIYIQKIDIFLKLNYIKIDDSLINPSDNIKYKLDTFEEINKQDILLIIETFFNTSSNFNIIISNLSLVNLKDIII